MNTGIAASVGFLKGMVPSQSTRPPSQLDPPVNWSPPILTKQVSTEYFSPTIFHQQFSTTCPPKCSHNKLRTKTFSKKYPKVQDQIFSQFTWSSLTVITIHRMYDSWKDDSMTLVKS